MFQPMPSQHGGGPAGFADMWTKHSDKRARGQNMLFMPLLKDIAWVFAMYICYVLIGGACFMSIERFWEVVISYFVYIFDRPLETQTCREVEIQLTNAHEAMKGLEALNEAHHEQLEKNHTELLTRRRRSSLYVTYKYITQT